MCGRGAAAALVPCSARFIVRVAWCSPSTSACCVYVRMARLGRVYRVVRVSRVA